MDVELDPENPEAVDLNKTWTVKGVSHEARNGAIQACRRAGMTQGEWLNRNIPLMIKAELGEQRSPAVIAASPPALPAAPPMHVHDIASVIVAANRIAMLTNQKPDRQILSAAKKQLRAVLAGQSAPPVNP